MSIPPEASVQTPEGAVAFVKFYFDQVNAAWMKPDDTLLPPLSHNDCNSCRNLQNDAVELKSKGHRMDPSPVALTDVVARDGATAGRQFVAATVSQTGAQEVDRSGVVVGKDEVDSGRYAMALIWRDGQWLMFGIDKD